LSGKNFSIIEKIDFYDICKCFALTGLTFGNYHYFYKYLRGSAADKKLQSSEIFVARKLCGFH